jgi:hypothetical protein
LVRNAWLRIGGHPAILAGAPAYLAAFFTIPAHLFPYKTMAFDLARRLQG